MKMKKSKIEIIGVYKVPITDDLLNELIQTLYKPPSSKEEEALVRNCCIETLENVVLIEVIVDNKSGKFDVSDFTQRIENIPKDNWQVAWAETYLNDDGDSLAVERWSTPPKTDTLRIAFFIHEWKSDIPLSTSFGDIDCPAIKPMPERLAQLVPYEPVD